MSSYCGFLEDQQRYPIFEIKNIGGRCEDFSDKAKPSHSCKTCIHLVAAGGLSDDRDRERDLAAMQLENIATKSQSSTPKSLLTKHREGASSRKAFELSGAYAAKGVMGNQPQYLDWCRALSKEAAYVITVMANPYDACTVWEPASGVASAQPKPKAAARTSKTRSGGAKVKAAQNTASGGVIADGNPPLTEAIVARFAQYLEAILDVRLTENEIGLVRQDLAATWQSGQQQGIDGALACNATLIHWTSRNRPCAISGANTTSRSTSVGSGRCKRLLPKHCWLCTTRQMRRLRRAILRSPTSPLSRQLTS